MSCYIESFLDYGVIMLADCLYIFAIMEDKGEFLPLLTDQKPL